MSTIKVNTIQTVNGTGEIKVSNPVLQGHTTKVDGINDGDGVLGTGSQIQLHGASPVLDIFSYSATTSTHGGINFMKSASNTVGTNTKIAENDIVGSIQFGGYDGNDFASIAGKIDFQMGGAQNGINQDDTAGEMVFYTTPDGSGGSGSTERLRITHTGDTQVKTGNLVMSTSQKGIDFSNFVSSDSAGNYQGTPTVTGHVLMDYEEGTWPGEFRGASGSSGSTANDSSRYATGHYTKIGRLVYVSITFELTNRGNWTGNVQVRGLPFRAQGSHNFAVTIGHNNFSAPQQYTASATASQSYIYLSFNDTSGQDYQTAVPAVSAPNDVYAFHGWYMTND